MINAIFGLQALQKLKLDFVSIFRERVILLLNDACNAEKRQIPIL
jgi:hypothetical protein